MKLGKIFYYFLRWCPGGAGLFLRQKFYPRILGKCGRKVLFGRFINIPDPKKISIGDNVVINDNVTFDAGTFSGHGPAITLGDNVFVGANCSLYSTDAKIVVHSGSNIGSFCHFKTTGNITVGKHVLLAAFCEIGCHKGDAKPMGPNHSKVASDMQTQDVHIEDGCWLGVRSVILPGACVGEGTIVGAHSVVKQSLPGFVVAFGNPAQVKRNRFET